MRIRGFTIVELLAVMVLSGMILILAWSVFTYFHVFGLEYAKRQHDSGELLRMDQIMRSDLSKAVSAGQEGDSLVLSCWVIGDSRIVWTVTGGRLVRLQGQSVDTFAVVASGISIVKKHGISEIRILRENGEGAGHLYYEVQDGGKARDSSRVIRY